jgi:hypothetical protein
MSGRLLITSASLLLIAAPAFADCTQEIDAVSEAVTQLETGASGAGTGLPATAHQEQVLPGQQQADTETAGQNAAGQADVPASPHQQQVLAGAQSGQQPADLVSQAKEMAEAGDEEGCMQKVGEAKNLLGID